MESVKESAAACLEVALANLAVAGIYLAGAGKVDLARVLDQVSVKVGLVKHEVEAEGNDDATAG